MARRTDRGRGTAAARCARAIAAVALGLLVCAAPAVAKGRWTQVASSKTPRVYYQGMSSGGAGLFFDGTHGSVFTTDFALGNPASGLAALPASVTTGRGYNHSGDLTWTPRAGGRVLLPLECYAPGAAKGGNTCGRGAIGVVDARTLRWLGIVELSTRELPKAMWVESSPDRRVVWTSSGRDLLAYAERDVVASAVSRPLYPVRRVHGASPVPKITGATFVGHRLFIAGPNGRRLQVWSVDVTTGSSRLEIDRRVDGESEGLATFDGLGGTLHWQVQPAKRRNPNAAGRILTFERTR